MIAMVTTHRHGYGPRQLGDTLGVALLCMIVRMSDAVYEMRHTVSEKLNLLLVGAVPLVHSHHATTCLSSYVNTGAVLYSFHWVSS